MDPVGNRIDQAWQQVKGWITEFEGAPTVTYLLNISGDSLPASFSTLAEQSDNFRITVISAKKHDQAVFIGIESLSTNLDLLKKDELAELSVNYIARLPEFDLDIHMVVYPMENELFALEVFWWGDQVFIEEADAPARFEAGMRYFISLQDLFHAPHMFLSPEENERPNGEEINWTEV